jgi:hypothetical protein
MENTEIKKVRNDFNSKIDAFEKKQAEVLGSKYIKALNNAISAYISATEPIIESIDDVRRTYQPRKQQELVAEFMIKLQEQKCIAIKNIDKAFEEYLKRLKAAFTVDGKNIDENDIRLLNADLFDLPQKDFDSLVHKYSMNYTMLVALQGYAEKKHLGFCIRDEKSKLKKAIEIRETAKGYVLNDNGYGVGAYCKDMAGQLFSDAYYLYE